MHLRKLEPQMNVNLIQTSTVFLLFREEICSEFARIADRHARAAAQLALNTRLALS